jgi:hypothetical protein
MNTILHKYGIILSKIILISGAIIYFAFGFAFLFTPDIITTMDGIILPDRPGANHIRGGDISNLFSFAAESAFAIMAAILFFITGEIRQEGCRDAQQYITSEPEVVDL